MSKIPSRGRPDSSSEASLPLEKKAKKSEVVKSTDSRVSIPADDIALFPSLTTAAVVSKEVLSNAPIKKEVYRGVGVSGGGGVSFDASLLSDHAMKVYKIELKEAEETAAAAQAGARVKPLIFEVLTYNSANRYQEIFSEEKKSFIQNNPFGKKEFLESPRDLYLRKKAQLELYKQRIKSGVDVLNLQEIKDIFQALKLDPLKLSPKEDPNSDQFEPFRSKRNLNPSELDEETMYQKLLVKEVLEFKKFLKEKGYEVAYSPPASALGSKQLAIIYNAKKFTKAGKENFVLRGRALQLDLEEKSPPEGRPPKKIAMVCCHLSPNEDYTAEIRDLKSANSTRGCTTVLIGDTNRTDSDDASRDGIEGEVMGDNILKENLPEGGAPGSVIGKNRELNRDIDRIGIGIAPGSAIKVTTVFRQVFVDSHKASTSKKVSRVISVVAIRPGTVIYDISAAGVVRAAQKTLATLACLAEARKLKPNSEREKS